MKKTYLVLLLCTSMYAQKQTTINVTKPITLKQNKESSSIMDLLRINPEKIIASRHDDTSIIFDTFNRFYELMQSTSTKRKKDELIIGHFKQYNTLNVITVDKTEELKQKFYCYSFDGKNSNQNKRLLFIDSVKHYRSLFKSRKAKVSVSPNGNYFAIAVRNDTANFVNVYDSKKNIVYRKVVFSNTKQYFLNEEVLVDNNAAVYCLGKKYNEYVGDYHFNLPHSIPSYNYALRKITQNKVIKLQINKKGGEWNNLKMLYSGHEIMLFGYKSGKSNKTNDSFSSLKINAETLEIIEEKQIDLPNQAIMDITGMESNTNNINDLFVDSILKDINGSIYIIAEQKAEEWKVEHNKHGVNESWSKNTKYYSIVILKCTLNGTLLWGRAIDKYTSNKNYIAFLKNKEIHVLLNTGKTKEKKYSNTIKFNEILERGSSLYVVGYNEQGNARYRKVKKNKGKKSFKLNYGLLFEGNYIIPRFK